MFLRKWTGLPEDPKFASDMKGLGYFINKDDEVRSLKDEQYYFNFFLSRNPRWNDRQRFHFNQAIQEEIHTRLTNLGLTKTALPLGTTDPASPRVPIFASANIATATRVVLIFGETTQDLGILAHRICGGPGGITRGSLVSVVRSLLQQRSSASDSSPPGIILANMGELLWWPAGQRTLSRTAFDAAPMTSAANAGNVIIPRLNHVPGNESPREHVNYVFEHVVRHLVGKEARLDVVGVGDGADIVEQYLDWAPVWKRLQGRMNCLALVGGLHPVWEIKCEGFKAFLRERARAYAISLEPANTPLSGPDSNAATTAFTSHGCPLFSSGESTHIELVLVAAKRVVCAWLQEVALFSPSPTHYKNPVMEVAYKDPELGAEPDWTEAQEEYVKHVAKMEAEAAAAASSSDDEGEGGGGVKDGEGEGVKKGEGSKKDKGKGKAKDDGFTVRVDTLESSEDED